ncbi:hypothetical protein DPMN_153549 [Dreissena polymorpha]|uniref:Uncharacterized protein n=1 Tax=Dreissena polymorpha TaxID=45954 RepID=A0A9D4J661_DREPO|nr:hypothetical protein DPMN_153549 [Dreissena polymorpha]
MFTAASRTLKSASVPNLTLKILHRISCFKTMLSTLTELVCLLMVMCTFFLLKLSIGPDYNHYQRLQHLSSIEHHPKAGTFLMATGINQLTSTSK